MRDEFKGIPFDDPALAEQRLSALLEPDRPGLAENMAAALAESPNPSTTLVRLERFLEASPAPHAELGRMAGAPRYAQLVCTVLGQSQHLTDIVCRHPEHMWWLWEDAVLFKARSRDAMLEELMTEVEECKSSQAAVPAEACAKAMRLFKRREILRIATREVFEHVTLDSLTEDISNLADATLEVACGAAFGDLARRFGRPMHRDDGGDVHDVTFVVLALGKLGGRELNFSSDIDLLFLYSDDGETTGGSVPPISNVEFFQKLGEYIIRLVSKPSDDGFVFRIDMRLRPYGVTSHLTASLESAIEYYEEYGQAWERQALIKARPAAGDLALGEEFVERTRRFVFPRYFDDETLEEIRQIKRQMELQIAGRGETEIEVKLGRGGIRDIEFTVQILQMLNGGRMPELRTRNTLDAIKALGRRAHLTAFEASTLASNYTFLRQVEHRLQIEGGRQCHTLPRDPAKLDEFASKLGYASGESFMAGYADRAKATREILDRFMATEGSGHLWVYDLLSAHSEGRIGMARLAQHGFKDLEKARRELRALCAGPPEQPHAFHVHELFAAIAPRLLAALSSCGDPDATLVRLGRLLANLRAPSAVYGILGSSPRLCEYLVTLVSNSEYLSEILIRDPGLFDVFGSEEALDRALSRQELEGQLAGLRQAYDADAAPYRLRDGETLRIGMRELFRNTSVVEVGGELTQLAEVCLAYALEKARGKITERYGDSQCAFAVLGFGRLGGREMGYGSDLDVVFVYEADARIDSGVAPAEYFAAIGSQTMRILKDVTRHGMLYDIDARLRPDGKKGMLAVSDKRIEQYYREEAQAWERLALVKVRAVAGDAEFGRAVEERARDIAFELPLTRESLDQIDSVRSKLVQKASPLDLKKDEGGIAGIEFGVRLLQLHQAKHYPELKRGDVLGALEILEGKGVFPAGQAGDLREAYLVLRKIENRIRMMHGRSESALPESPEGRADLARRLRIDEDIAELVKRHKARAHEIYMDILGRVSG